MRIAIDIVLVITLLYCTWMGYKKGLVNTLISIAAIIVALALGGIISDAFAGEAIPAIKPFVSGFVESKSTGAQDVLGITDKGQSLSDAIAEEPELVYDFCEENFKAVGFHAKRADDLAERAVELINEEQLLPKEAVTEVCCDVITYLMGLAVASALIIIFISVIINYYNLSFKFKNNQMLDERGGIAAGFFKGVILCVLLCWLLSFCGIIIGKTTLSKTALGKLFLSFEFITNLLY